MALDFGLINSGLFPQSDATGDGLSATGQIKQLADAGAAGEGHIMFNLAAYESIEQGTWAWDAGQSPNSILAGWWQNSTAVQNDAITYKAYLSVGKYTATFVVTKGTDRGKIHLLIDGVDKGSVNCYNGSTLYNQRLQITGISVDSASIKSIQLKISDKDGSSSSYFSGISILSLHRTL